MLNNEGIEYDAVKVKNACLINLGDNEFILQHYKTIILRVEHGEIKVIKPCSPSSTRAINQALDWLYSNRYTNIFQSCKAICEDKISKGETIDRSY